MNFGTKIKECRKKIGMSQKQLAEILGLPTSTLANYENNHRRVSASMLLNIANILNVSVNELTGIEVATYKLDPDGELKETNDIETKNNASIFTYNQKYGTNIGLPWTKENYKLDPARYFIDTMSKYINEVDNDALKLIISNIENVEILKNTSEYINVQIDLLEGNLFD